jgi:hypothetical protein
VSLDIPASQDIDCMNLSTRSTYKRNPNNNPHKPLRNDDYEKKCGGISGASGAASVGYVYRSYHRVQKEDVEGVAWITWWITRGR